MDVGAHTPLRAYVIYRTSTHTHTHTHTHTNTLSSRSHTKHTYTQTTLFLPKQVTYSSLTRPYILVEHLRPFNRYHSHTHCCYRSIDNVRFPTAGGAVE